MDKILTINNWKSLREVRFIPLNHIDWVISEYVEDTTPAYEYQINAGTTERLYTIRIHRDLEYSDRVRVSIWNDTKNKLHSTGLIPLREMRSLAAFKEVLEGDKWLR